MLLQIGILLLPWNRNGENVQDLQAAFFHTENMKGTATTDLQKQTDTSKNLLNPYNSLVCWTTWNLKQYISFTNHAHAQMGV